MPRKQNDIHYIYKTTCNVTKRYYIGMHSTSNLDDGYMGSGTRLRRSIRKYGEENHVKEILEFFERREELVKREIELVTEELICDELCMNLKCGGYGGFVNDEHIKNMRIGASKHLITKWSNEDYREKITSQLKQNREKNYKEGKFKPLNWKGKKHSLKTIQSMSLSRKGSGLKQKNSQYGTCWITDGIKSKKIKKEFEIPEGWYRGRK